MQELTDQEYVAGAVLRTIARERHEDMPTIPTALHLFFALALADRRRVQNTRMPPVDVSEADKALVVLADAVWAYRAREADHDLEGVGDI